MMMTGRASAQMPSPSAFSRSRPLAFGCSFTVMSRTTNIQAQTRPMPISRPGTMPAMNSALIEVLVVTPKMMKGMLGGMIGAMMPPDAIRPAERGTG